MNQFSIILGLIGIVLILTKSYIFEYFRDLVELKNKHLGVFVRCSMCVGFWIGLFYSLLKNQFTINYIDHLLYAAMISLLSYVVDVILTFLEIKTNVLLFQKNDRTTKTTD